MQLPAPLTSAASSKGAQQDARGQQELQKECCNGIPLLLLQQPHLEDGAVLDIAVVAAVPVPDVVLQGGLRRGKLC